MYTVQNTTLKEDSGGINLCETRFYVQNLANIDDKITDNYNYNAMNTVTTLETVITVHTGSTVQASNYTSYLCIYTTSDGIPERAESNTAAAVKTTQESRG